MTQKSQLPYHCKRIIAFLTVFVMVLVSFLASSQPSYAASKPVTVVLDGQVLSFDAEPEIISGTTFVPMRGIFEALDLEVNWNESRREASASLDWSDDPVSHGEIILKIGAKTAICGADADVLPAAPYIKDGRTMMPLRYISESTGCKVQWDSDTYTVTITSPEDRRKDAAEDSDSEGEAKEPDGDASEISGILTYDDAIAAAVKNSKAVESAQLSYKEQNRYLTEFQWLYRTSDDFNIWQKRKDLTIYRSWAEKLVALTQEQTAYAAVSGMDRISLQDMSIAQKEREIRYLKECVNRMKLKTELGAASNKEYLSKKAELDTAVKELETQQLERSSLYTTLQQTVPVENLRERTPEFLLDYEPLTDFDIDEHIRREMENDPYIWFAEQQLDSAEFKMDTYDYNGAAKSTYLTRVDIEKAANNVESTKQKFDSALRSRYEALLETEDQIASLELKLENIRENVDTLRLLYEVGRTTRESLEELLQQKAALEVSIRSLKVSHSLNKMALEKPYLNPTYMTA